MCGGGGEGGRAILLEAEVFDLQLFFFGDICTAIFSKRKKENAGAACIKNSDPKDSYSSFF